MMNRREETKVKKKKELDFKKSISVNVQSFVSVLCFLFVFFCMLHTPNHFNHFNRLLLQQVPNNRPCPTEGQRSDQREWSSQFSVVSWLLLSLLFASSVSLCTSFKSKFIKCVAGFEEQKWWVSGDLSRAFCLFVCLYQQKNVQHNSLKRKTFEILLV